MVALKHSSTNVRISMSQEVYLRMMNLLTTVMIVIMVTITTMMKTMHGFLNPQWLLIVLILDHLFTTKTSSQMHCCTSIQHAYAKSKGASKYCCSLKKLP